MMTETSVPVTTNDPAPVHNATTQPTVKTDPGQAQTTLAWRRINAPYFKTIPGIIKIVQAIFGIICMACASPVVSAGSHWFMFVAVISFIATIFWIFVYLFSLRELLKVPINWLLTELLNTSVTVVLYFIAFVVQLSAWFPYYYRNVNITAGVFGVFNTIAYAAGAYFLFIEWKRARMAN